MKHILTTLIPGLLLALLFTGCGARTGWTERHVPTTEAERQVVAQHVERIMAATPRQLAGHDQDWDDAIRAAHEEACATLCRTTLWEWNDSAAGTIFQYTGRWRYAEEAKPDTQRSDTPVIGH